MKELRVDDVLFQRQQSTNLTTKAGLSKGWLNRQMEQVRKALNITATAPKSIMSEIVRCLRKL